MEEMLGSKFGFFKLIECIILKCHSVKQNAKICAIGEQKTECNIIEVFILGGQRIDQKREKGWWRGRRERIEKGRERG